MPSAGVSYEPHQESGGPREAAQQTEDLGLRRVQHDQDQAGAGRAGVTCVWAAQQAESTCECLFLSNHP